ncbi:sensor histidine kinase [Stenotrophomonas rhizophila]|uniref:histidine kinase n=1 Tax=Stenotrophomonas rhizophila TaxID=216778 RepID=A0AAW5PG03_9GAMM|nr:ATP-binding protein [Stenotrophomonas rhizophila]MCS4279084.1 two-component system sensor histidine kinase UhpB [Stenotrophomonas rhizophila]
MHVNATVKHIAAVDSTTDIPPDDPANPSPSTRTSPALRVTLTLVAPLLLGCLLGQLLPTLAQMPGFRLHVLWIPGPLLLGWLLFTPRAQWRTCILAACAGTALAFAFAPFLGLTHLIASAGEFALVIGVAWLLLRWRGDRAPLEGYRDIGLFVLVGCVALPVCVGLWQAVLLSGHRTGAASGAIGALWLCSAVSYLLIVPCVVNVARVLQTPERRDGWQWRTAVIAVLLLVVLGLVWGVDWADGVMTPLLVLAPIPLLVWALIVLGVSGASAYMLIVAVLGMQLSMQDIGPFALWTTDHNLITAQVWTLGTGCALLFLGALSEQRLSNHLKLKQAYRRLGEVTGRMLVVQEEERTRIARDLHDDVNQSLAAISICLSALRNQIPETERHRVIDLQDQLLTVSNDIRSISHELHPSILRFTGLASALDAFCIKRNARGALRVRCRIDDLPRLRDDQELSLFRIMQEAVNNVDKHARARAAQILVTVRGEQMVLRVDDDGIGMPASHGPAAPGLGMISMEERARLLGGTLQVSASPLGGTRIEVRFPLSGTVRSMPPLRSAVHQ